MKKIYSITCFLPIVLAIYRVQNPTFNGSRMCSIMSARNLKSSRWQRVYNESSRVLAIQHINWIFSFDILIYYISLSNSTEYLHLKSKVTSFIPLIINTRSSV